MPRYFFRWPIAARVLAAHPLVATFGLCWRERPKADDKRRWAYCSESLSFVEAQFMGLHRKGLVQPGDWHVVTLYPPMSLGSIWDSVKYFRNIIRPSVMVKVWNARDLEEMERLSKKDFFEKHGFVLLDRRTAMSAADWIASSPKTLDISHFTGFGMPDGETPVSQIYAKEVEQIVRELYPESKELELDPLCARRGPGTKNPSYSFAPHNDYGFTADDWPIGRSDFKERFASPDVRGMMAINFWRPVLPMREPVRKTPLAVCDPGTVQWEHILPISIKWDHMPHHKMLAIAHDESQRWYYYPSMTTDEVLIFKSFQYFKSQSGPEFNTCFHTAFQDPTAPQGSEERQSAEYRVRVWF